MTVDVFIEISKGSTVKYEVDEETGKLRADRFLHGAMYFPFNYGYVEGSIGEDNDPLDAVVLASKEVVPGCLIKCKPLGLLEMEDEGGVDTKIILVPVVGVDPIFGQMESIDDVPKITKEKIRNFFEHYKDLEKDKWVKLKDWKGQKEAVEAIEKGRK
ncbi:inorganic diphosphatase [Patescibacteria group bacterium]|nr:inorganic diphosphatase [Patescibacteria group bacterium]